MQTMKLEHVYRSMLATAGMDVTADGYARMEIEGGEFLPVTGKDGKAVVLPLPERLRDPAVDKTEVFHLLSENSKVNNASDLLTRYRHWLICRFNAAIGGLGAALLRIAADEAMSKALRPDQKAFRELVVEADEDTVKAFNELADICASPSQIQQVFMSMYIRKAAVLDGKSYGRVTAVAFPFYEELMKLETDVLEAKKTAKGQKKPVVKHEIYGVELRKKDRPTLIGLMHYLIPNLDTPHAYDVGSNSTVAPSVDSMMRAFLPLARHLNDIVELLKGIKPEMDRVLDTLVFDLDWAEAFEDLDALWPQIRMTPQQNQGVIDEPAPAKPVAAATPPWNPTPAPAPAQAGYPAPAMGGYPMPAPAAATRPASSGGGVSVNAMMSMSRHHHLPPAPAMNPYANPYGPPQHPMAGQYPQPAQGGYPAPMGYGNPMGPSRKY